MRTLAFVLVWLAAGANLLAQKTEAPQAADPSLAALKFLVMEHDFEKITDEKSVAFSFTFVNTSDKLTVNVRNVQSTCGCTAADLGKRVYAPGERGQIDVTFNPTGKHGREQKSIFVDTDDPRAPRLELKIMATVIQRIRVEPASLWFGEVRYDNVIGTISPKRIQITTTVPDFQVKGVTVEDKRFAVRTLKTDQVEKAGEKATRTTYEISVDENLPIGRIQTQGTFETNDAKQPKIAFTILLDAVGDLRVTPERMFIQTRSASEAFAQDTTLVHRDNGEFKVTGATVVNAENKEFAGMKAEITPLNPTHTSMWRVKLTGTGPTTAGQQFSGTLKITTDSPLQPNVDVPFTGMLVVQQPVPPAVPTTSK